MTAPQPPIYEIRVAGRLSSNWDAWFDGLSVTSDADGTSVIRGSVVDQAALHGLLQKLRDVGLGGGVPPVFDDSNATLLGKFIGGEVSFHVFDPVLPGEHGYRYFPSFYRHVFDTMRRAHVALTPGRDFGRHDPERWLRLSFATSRDRLEEALHRLAREL